jgi:methylase of polypeptide subunit release factors
MPPSQRELSSAKQLISRLVAAGFDEANVALWFGVPLVTDARFVRRPPARPRRGLGGWIALLVAGEPLPRSSLLPAPDDEALAALVALGLVAVGEGLVQPRATILPWRGLVVASAPAEAFDVSALNVAASLPVTPSLWDVGCGAGLLGLAAARAGARVFASDVDADLVEWARLNAALNGVTLALGVGDLLAAAPAEARFATLVFNAPLLRAPLATADEAPRYTSSARGEALALEFLDGAKARLAEGGTLLLHAQLTHEVSVALDRWAATSAVSCVRFAEAPDGTPHALTEIRTGAPAGRRDVRVPLSPACLHLSRAIFEALAGPRVLAPEVTPLPAPWLELRTSEQFSDGGRRRTLRVSLGGVTIAAEELALLDRLRGESLGALGLGAGDRERLESLVARGLVILR